MSHNGPEGKVEGFFCLDFPFVVFGTRIKYFGDFVVFCRRDF